MFGESRNDEERGECIIGVIGSEIRIGDVNCGGDAGGGREVDGMVEGLGCLARIGDKLSSKLLPGGGVKKTSLLGLEAEAGGAVEESEFEGGRGSDVVIIGVSLAEAEAESDGRWRAVEVEVREVS